MLRRSCFEISKNNQRHPYEYVKKCFEDKHYTLLSETYKNKNEKLKYVCNKHKDFGVQEVSFGSLQNRKYNCKICRFENLSLNWHSIREFKKITDEEFYEKHFEKYEDKLYTYVKDEYSLLNIYSINKRTMMTVKHNVCGKIYDVNVYKFFQGNHRCQNKICKSKRFRERQLKTVEELQRQIYDLYGDEYKVLGEYTGQHEKTTFYHKICGKTFLKTPSSILAGHLCPHCIRPTVGEQKIIDILEKYNINYTFQHQYLDLVGDYGYQLSYDFYIDDYNLLVEYQGEFHDDTLVGRAQSLEKFERQQKYDERKRQYAKDRNIELLEIWYWDFDNIENILISRLNIKQSA